MFANDYDIAIVGGGLAGLSAACILANLPIKIVLIDQSDLLEKDFKIQNRYDGRGIALNYCTELALSQSSVFFKDIGMKTSILQVIARKVANGQQLTLNYIQTMLPRLGSLVPYELLLETLIIAVKNFANISIYSSTSVQHIMSTEVATKLIIKDSDKQLTMTARLILSADGIHSKLRQQSGVYSMTEDYPHHAFITDLEMSKPNCNIAYQLYHQKLVCALLPMDINKFKCVVSADEGVVKSLLELKDLCLKVKIQQLIGMECRWQHGSISNIGNRHSFPLKKNAASKLTGHRIIFLGAAASHVHPVAAQGYNLIVRDLVTLHEILSESIEDCGSQDKLMQYEHVRLKAHEKLRWLTDILHAPDPALLDMSLLLFSSTPFLQQRLYQGLAAG